jgi:hypothetical protein
VGEWVAIEAGRTIMAAKVMEATVATNSVVVVEGVEDQAGIVSIAVVRIEAVESKAELSKVVCLARVSLGKASLLLTQEFVNVHTHDVSVDNVSYSLDKHLRRHRESVSLRCFVDSLDLYLNRIEKQIFWT